MVDFEIVFWSNRGALGTDYTSKSGWTPVNLQMSLCPLSLCLWSIIGFKIVVNGSKQDHCVTSSHSKSWRWLQRGQWPPPPTPAPEKTASIIDFSCLRTDTHLHVHACALVHSVPAGEQVAHLYNPTDCSNGTRGPNYILMDSILLLASSREQEQNHTVSIFGGNSIILLVETVSRKHTWTSVGFAYCNKIKNYSCNYCFCLFFFLKKKKTITTEYGLRLRILEDHVIAEILVDHVIMVSKIDSCAKSRLVAGLEY